MAELAEGGCRLRCCVGVMPTGVLARDPRTEEDQGDWGKGEIRWFQYLSIKVMSNPCCLHLTLILFLKSRHESMEMMMMKAMTLTMMMMMMMMMLMMMMMMMMMIIENAFH